jgi:hypothetical protein
MSMSQRFHYSLYHCLYIWMIIILLTCTMDCSFVTLVIISFYSNETVRFSQWNPFLMSFILVDMNGTFVYFITNSFYLNMTFRFHHQDHFLVYFNFWYITPSMRALVYMCYVYRFHSCFCDFLIGIWNCFDVVVFFTFNIDTIFLAYVSYYATEVFQQA